MLKAKASTRIPSFRRFIRSKSSNGTPKYFRFKKQGVIDGQNVRKNYFRSLRQVKENARCHNMPGCKDTVASINGRRQSGKRRRKKV